MITEKEIEAVNLSATKADFYQIWNELLETAEKLSERWSPESTNESDPGIVLLKVLTAIADKLNYTVDKSTLECFLPSAAQEESMKKLCDMMGYNMKYYQSATTDVTISYTGEDVIADNTVLKDTGVILPAYTNIKNADGDVNYFILPTQAAFILDDDVNKTISVPCMEGEAILCADDTDNIVSMNNIDDNFRYYLPENQIAENGIFIYNVDDSNVSELWEKVDNLNTQEVGKKCFKFGFDSRLSMPYIQFPADISTIIEDGLVIRYTRTNGVNGNISYNTLTTLEAPQLWSDSKYSEASSILDIANFAVKNASAATNGRNKESINDAYNNYKKTIGTFDTLVTCRDYMNKIYTLTVSDTDTTPLVSNIVASDIRDDINRAVTLCTFNEYGIVYKDMSLKHGKEEIAYDKWVGAESDIDKSKQTVNLIYKVGAKTATTFTYYKVICEYGVYKAVEIPGTKEVNDINNFDLVLYPFTTISGSVGKDNYINSFKYSTANKSEIETELEKYKTISHNFVYPASEEIVCIKNYLRLNAKITTTTKVNAVEEALILNNIKTAIYNNFNARKIDFGEEIPFDTILKVIQEADTKIKNVSLDEPELYTKFCLASGAELFYAGDSPTENAKEAYNKLALRNVLAGKIAAFQYNTDFKPSFSDKTYNNIDSIVGPKTEGGKDYYIGKLESNFTISASSSATEIKDIKLTENEVVQFRAPNFKTTKTYPAYVNYFIQLNNTTAHTAIPATFGSLRNYMNDSIWGTFVNQKDSAGKFIIKLAEFKIKSTTKRADLVTLETTYGRLFEYNSADTKYTIYSIPNPGVTIDQKTIYYFDITNETYGSLFNFITAQYANYCLGTTEVNNGTAGNPPSDWSSAWATKYKNKIYEKTGTTFSLVTSETAPTYASGTYYWPEKLKGIFRSLGADLTRAIGKMVDMKHIKYDYCNSVLASLAPLDNYYIQTTWETEEASISGHTKDGFGKNSESSGIKANEDYELKSGEYLCINYTPSTTEDGEATAINTVYTAGAIIRPNFELINSKTYKQAGHSPSKTSGYNFDSPYMEDINDTTGGIKAGMFSLGVNEQIELREKIEVELDDSAVNIYWERNDEDEFTKDEKVTFNFDEDYDETNKIYLAYTLKEGEYFYYTDGSKIDLAYYGNGTKIVRTISTPEIAKKKVNTASLTQAIANYGLLAALPWEQYDFSKQGSIEKKLTLKEYQYLVLTAGDTLKTLASDDKIAQKTTKNWTAVEDNKATYCLQDSDTVLSLSALNITGIQWEVKSILNINLAKNIIQTLHATVDTEKNYITKDELIAKYYYIESGYEVPATNKDKVLSPTGSQNYLPLSLESNYLRQSSYGRVDTHIPGEYDEDGNIIEYKNDFKLKCFENKEIKGSKGTGAETKEVTVNLNNYGTGNWTKIAFSMYDKIDLNINLLDNTHGLMMLYYLDEETDPSKKAYITLTNTGATDATVNICNANNDSLGKFDTNGWWTGHHLTEKYHLQNGLNIIELPNKCTLTIHAGNNAANSTLVFSDLDLVNYANNNFVINSAIDYKGRTINGNEDNTPIKQLLSDIAKVDTQYKFYYNTVIDTTTAIDLNTAVDEKLSDAAAWYSYNNINNKFVISEIDANYLSSGITLATSSKR